MPQDDLSAVSTQPECKKPLQCAAMSGIKANSGAPNPGFAPASLPAGAFVAPGNPELLALHRALEAFGRAVFRLQDFNARLHKLNEQAKAVIAGPASPAHSQSLASRCRITWLNAKLITAARRIEGEQSHYLRALARVAQALPPVLRGPAGPHYISMAQTLLPQLNAEQRAVLLAACPQLNLESTLQS
jgi:hypothetical protein